MSPRYACRPCCDQRKTLVYLSDVDQGGTKQAGANRAPNLEPVRLGEFQYGLGTLPGNFVILQPHIEQTVMELGIGEAIGVVQLSCQRYCLGGTIVRAIGIAAGPKE